jgi:hypothetical protein
MHFTVFMLPAVDPDRSMQGGSAGTQGFSLLGLRSLSENLPAMVGRASATSAVLVFERDLVA